MGFLSSIISATVKVAISPVAIVADAVKVATGNEPDTTKDLLESAGEDASDALDDIFD